MLFCLSLLSILSFVSASYYNPADFLRENVGQALDIAKQTVTPIFELLLGEGESGEFFLAKSLLLILIFVIVLTVVKKMPLIKDAPNKNAIALVITIAVSLLSIRYIPDNDLINGVLLPYTTFGIALTTFIPFLIYFWFVHESVPNPTGRRLAWIVYAIIFISLWVIRSDEMGAGNTIYTVGLLIIVIMFLFDKSIHQYFRLSDFAKTEEDFKRRTRLRAYKDINDAESILSTNPDNKDAKKILENARRVLRENT